MDRCQQSLTWRVVASSCAFCLALLFSAPTWALELVGKNSQTVTAWCEVNSEIPGQVCGSSLAQVGTNLVGLGSFGYPEGPVVSCTDLGPAGGGQYLLRCLNASNNILDVYVASTTTTSESCPQYSTETPASTPQCECVPGYTAQGTQCVAPVCEVGTVMGSGYYDLGTSSQATPQMSACQGGCYGVFDGVSPAGSAFVDGVQHWFAQGEYIRTGDNCQTQSGPSGEATLPTGTCASGQTQGTVNGKTVCVNSSGEVTAQPIEKEVTVDTEKTVTQNPDGTTTTTETTTKNWGGAGGSGSSTTTKETTCDAAGNCTTTESTTGDEEPTEEQKSECELNPDAVGCAELGEVTDADLDTDSVPVDADAQSGWGAADAACPAPRVVSVLGMSVPIDNSLLCEFLEGIRFAVVGAFGIVAAMVFIGGLRST